jgi:hypothetical protein
MIDIWFSFDDGTNPAWVSREFFPHVEKRDNSTGQVITTLANGVFIGAVANDSDLINPPDRWLLSWEIIDDSDFITLVESAKNAFATVTIETPYLDAMETITGKIVPGTFSVTPRAGAVYALSFEVQAI